MVGDVDLEGGDASERARRGPDLGREVRQRRDVVAEDGADAREAVAGQLHAVAGVARESDDDAVELLQRMLSGGRLTHGSAPLLVAGRRASWYRRSPRQRLSYALDASKML